jgi:hypothetical protein
MQEASLNSSYPRKSNLLKIVKVDGKAYWRNSNKTEHWGIGDVGFLLYNAHHQKLLTNHVEKHLHQHVLSIQEKEPIRLLQRNAGNGGCQSGGPYKVGMRVINCDENGKLPHGLIWRDVIPPNLPFLQLIFVNANRRILLVI